MNLKEEKNQKDFNTPLAVLSTPQYPLTPETLNTTVKNIELLPA